MITVYTKIKKFISETCKETAFLGMWLQRDEYLVESKPVVDEINGINVALIKGKLHYI